MAGRKELFACLFGVYLNRVAAFTHYVGLAPGDNQKRHSKDWGPLGGALKARAPNNRPLSFYIRRVPQARNKKCSNLNLFRPASLPNFVRQSPCYNGPIGRLSNHCENMSANRARLRVCPSPFPEGTGPAKAGRGAQGSPREQAFLPLLCMHFCLPRRPNHYPLIMAMTTTASPTDLHHGRRSAGHCR